MPRVLRLHTRVMIIGRKEKKEMEKCENCRNCLRRESPRNTWDSQDILGTRNLKICGDQAHPEQKKSLLNVK